MELDGGGYCSVLMWFVEDMHQQKMLKCIVKKRDAYFIFQKELDRFDPLYLSAKERSLKSGRNDVEQVDRKLMETLRRFNLQDTVTAFNQVNFILRIYTFYIFYCFLYVFIPVVFV